MHDQLNHLRPARPVRRRRVRGAIIAAAVLVPVLTAGGVLWAVRTQGSAEQTAADYLAAWSRQDYAAMRALTADPPQDFEQRHQRFRADLKLTGATFEVGRDTKELEEGKAVPFHAKLEGPVALAYEGRLYLG